MNNTKSGSENYNLEKGTLLPLMEEFYTIQGEGYNTGQPAYFIRLGGCDVGCHWCDVKESWDATLHPPVPTDSIIRNAIECPAKAVVVTGGEPAMYNLEYLTKKLKEKNIKIFLETSGAYPLTGTWDWICLSPKKNNPPRKDFFSLANELKVIVHNKNDFNWAEENAMQFLNAVPAMEKTRHLFLQPEWSKAKEMMPLIINYVMNHPQWNISLQSHKYMNIP